MKFLNAVRRGLVPAAAAGLAIATGSAPLAAQCFRNTEYMPSCARPSPTDKPALVAESNNLHVFVRGTDNGLWHRLRTGPDAMGSWSPWESVGSGILSGPGASLRPGSGIIDVFVRGATSQLLQRWLLNGVWSNWADLGGGITSDPASISWGPGRIDVFARNADNSLGHIWWQQGGNWSAWESLGGLLNGGRTAGPTVASWSANRLDVFVAGNGGYMYTKAWFGSSWSEWAPVGCCIVGTPAASSRGGSTLYVSALGTDGRLFGQSYSGGWSGWQYELSTWAALSSPALVYRAQPAGTELVAMGTNGILMRLAADAAGNWGYWQPLMAGPYLTDIRVSSSRDYNTAVTGCPAGYAVSQQDLNQSAGGAYVFFCLAWGYNPAFAIYSLGVQATDRDGTPLYSSFCKSTPSMQWTKGTDDLNAGAGGRYVYLCIGTLATNVQSVTATYPKTMPPLSNVRFVTTTIPLPPGARDPCGDEGTSVRYAGNSANDVADFNAGAGGKFLYACMVRSPK